MRIMINRSNLNIISLSRLLDNYDINEARSIIKILLEDCFGLSYTDICCGALDKLSDKDVERLESMMQELRNNVPVQYVTGKAFFSNRIFHVSDGVLIPRPETEELCQWITDDMAVSRESISKSEGIRILDVGTGSGCIAITLALDNAGTKVTAWDISEKALDIARMNAGNLHADVEFIKQDALNAIANECEMYDVIVSNPPYICMKEADEMEENVLEHEPHLALFVPDDSPLLFYRAITEYASKSLRPGGALYFEINPIYNKEMTTLLHSFGFHDVEIRQDVFGKDRMVKGVR